MTPAITIGTPVYNGMPWIRETIESIRRQTCADFAVLVIDNGSTDGAGKYRCSLRDSRFRIVTQENPGITATLNRMLAETESPWLMRQDADDIASRNGLPGRWSTSSAIPKRGCFIRMLAIIKTTKPWGACLPRR
jgi:glycosyltransferase involved in cell wall biosynthesis